jgi:hypothetical protein
MKTPTLQELLDGLLMDSGFAAGCGAEEDYEQKRLVMD